MLLVCPWLGREHFDVDCTQIVQAVPVLQECLRMPLPKLFHHVWWHPRNKVEGCSANLEAVPCDVGVSLVCCSENPVDVAYKLGPGECYNIVVCVMVCGDGMIDVQPIFNKMLVDGVNGVQRGFLAWNPYIVTSSFLSFGLWEVKVTGTILGC